MTRNALFVAVLVGISIAGTAAGAPTLPKVSPDEEKEALRLFGLGNDAMEDGSTEEAIKAFRQALKHWDHPAIHYNLAMALGDAANPLERHRHLEGAMRYGPGFLADPAMYEKAKGLKAKLEAELVRLEVSCEEPGAQVSVDERKDLFACPKAFSEWMLPGDHVVRLAKAGFSHPNEKRLTLKKGEKAELRLRLYPDDQWIQYRALWPRWAAWVAGGVGGAAVVVGAGLNIAAGGEYRAYDSGIALCAGTPGDLGFEPCSPSPDLEVHLAQGDRLQGMAAGLYVVGALAVAAGAALYFLEVQRPVLVNPETGVQIGVAPLVVPGGGGAVLTLGF